MTFGSPVSNSRDRPGQNGSWARVPAWKASHIGWLRQVFIGLAMTAAIVYQVRRESRTLQQERPLVNALAEQYTVIGREVEGDGPGSDLAGAAAGRCQGAAGRHPADRSLWPAQVEPLILADFEYLSGELPLRR